MAHFTSSTTYEPGFPATWEGLDIQSAIDATPRWYGVSSGNGNDGVSHMWPDYFVRCADPWLLAQCAIVGLFTPGTGYAFALENLEIDGEVEYTISATILNPPDDDTNEDDDDAEMWCNVNGAWLIVEVFLSDPAESRSSCMRYDSIDDAFSADLLAFCTGT